MSAFLVNESTLYKTMRAIKVASKNSWNHDLKDELDANPGGVFYKLNYLNRHALNQRYDEPIGKASYKFSSSEWARANYKFSNIEVYKALTCFTYQCAEGSTVKRKLYKQLDQLENSLASFIISKLPEYDQASWG